ncbi:50S ribosomal protein L4 [Pontibacter sp. G13]|uniref:50S ribosomal protein L4 n=1 Tax=Pontibacter sp. G13 TaxID=3074898 RepID=UPI00288A5AD1|nr:50S ribosomal protein L4 [Pontibacter sp. G13]WNJ16518.1 50S ribosomal protein L4 [Pontibacter sp. G13]
MEVAVYNIQGSDTGKKINLSEAVFGLETPNDHAIYMDVKQYLANQRQGTSKSKERGEVHGTGKKPYRQKGTGNARQGDRKSPLWRHGGRIFGPKPRDYSFRLNKKIKVLARSSALTYKAKEENVRVLENFNFEAPKTKQFLDLLNGMEAQDKKVLLVTGDVQKNVYLSGRNLPKASVLPASQLNTFAILNADLLVLTEDAVNFINQREEN